MRGFRRSIPFLVPLSHTQTPHTYSYTNRKENIICTFSYIPSLLYNGAENKEQEEVGMFGFHKKTKKVCISVTEYEYHIMLDSLLKFRDKLIEQGKYTDGVDETILAISK